MTKQEAIKNHRKMWNWIADQIEERKGVVRKVEYFNEMKTPLEERPSSGCFCCEYKKTMKGYGCDCCPIKWPVEMGNKGSYCMGGGNLYAEFYEIQLDHSLYGKPFNYERAAELARQIANLPEREEL